MIKDGINSQKDQFEGILLVNKPKGITSFRVIQIVRRCFNLKTVGHAGTLDPFATGLLIVLLGRPFTRLSDQIMAGEKEYLAKIRFGTTTTTHDPEGDVVATSERVPELQEITSEIKTFCGEFLQTPPMFSAKKIGGKKLYDLARKGEVVERKPVLIKAQTDFISYEYPYLEVRVTCSKGTYIRSLAHDMAQNLGVCGHLEELSRTKSGTFHLKDAISIETIQNTQRDMLHQFLRTEV